MESVGMALMTTKRDKLNVLNRRSKAQNTAVLQFVNRMLRCKINCLVTHKFCKLIAAKYFHTNRER